MNKKKLCGYCGSEFPPDQNYYSYCNSCKENEYIRYGDEVQSKMINAMGVLLNTLNHYETEELARSGSMHKLITIMLNNMPAKDVLTLAEKAVK